MTDSNTKPCPQCSEQILQTANKCKHCGSVLKSKGVVRPLAKALLIFLIICMASCYGCLKALDRIDSKNPKLSKQKEDKPLTLTKQQIEPILNMEKDGLLRLTCNLNQAHIDPIVWARLDIQVKENLSRGLAIYCCNKKGTRIYWIDVIDKMSGRKLAKWSRAWGFSIE